jgi:hypothetical protein
MRRIKSILMYLLALIVLISPIVLLALMGLSLFGGFGLILGIVTGLIVFAISVNKIISMDAANSKKIAAATEPSAPVSTDEKPRETGETLAPEGR